MTDTPINNTIYARLLLSHLKSLTKYKRQAVFFFILARQPFFRFYFAQKAQRAAVKADNYLFLCRINARALEESPHMFAEPDRLRKMLQLN